MRKGFLRFQIGKNGVTDQFVENLQNAFKKNKNVRISVLQSAVSEREKIKDIAEDLCNKLTGNFRYKIIGFTIVLMRKGSL